MIAETTKLEGKRVLVTGGSSGIGACIARELAAAGCTVGICARRSQLLASVLEDLRRHAADSVALTVDLSDLDEIETFSRQVETALGGVDILVNNAGQMGALRLPENNWADAERFVRVNYLSPVRLTLALLPGMLERGSGQILNISSVAAKLNPPTESAYAGSKAALTAYFEAAAADLAGRGVTIHNFYPGWIRTSDEPPDSLHRDMEGERPEDVAVAVRRQLETAVFEAYFPEEFRDIYVNRSKDVPAFVEYSAGWARERIESDPRRAVS